MPDNCPCNTIKLCSFYQKMDDYLIKNRLVDINDKYSYFKLINNVKNDKLYINPYEIWDLSQEDPSARVISDFWVTKRCIDSLYYKSAETSGDSKTVVDNFEAKNFGILLSDETLKRACTNMEKNPTDWVAIHFYLWNAILEKSTEKYNLEMGRK